MEDIKIENQMNIFDILGVEEDWKKEWQDMPEFVQEDLTPHQQIIISFNSDKDVKDFGKLINQKLTYKTKSIWFPETQRGKFKDYTYVDSKEDKSYDNIPKRFIRIWLGERKLPEQFEKWWLDFQEIHPDYEFLTITEDNYKDYQMTDELTEIFNKCETYAGRTDILRILILYQLGGIYVDTDVMPLKSFDSIVNSNKPFLGKRSSKSFESAVIGSPKEHVALLDVLEALPKWFYEKEGKACSVRTGPTFLSSVLYGRSDVTHLPTLTFYPYDGFMAPKREKKQEMFTNTENFPDEMIAAHFSNRIWGGNPNKKRNEK